MSHKEINAAPGNRPLTPEEVQQRLREAQIADVKAYLEYGLKRAHQRAQRELEDFARDLKDQQALTERGRPAIMAHGAIQAGIANRFVVEYAVFRDIAESILGMLGEK